MIIQSSVLINMRISDDGLPFEKIITMQNKTLFIKSVFNKDRNHYYHEKCLERCS